MVSENSFLEILKSNDIDKEHVPVKTLDPIDPYGDDSDLPFVKAQGFCALIRHGERADKVNYEKQGIKIEQFLDPPLTPQGFEQAQDTGLHFKKYLAEHGYDSIVIESSPFLRTMQTASIVAKHLGIEKIKINYGLAKWMRCKSYAAKVKACQPIINPFDKLLIDSNQDAEVD